MQGQAGGHSLGGCSLVTALAPACATYADPFFMGLAAGLGLLSCDMGCGRVRR